MNIRELGCRACAEITSGDCGAHGPRVVGVAVPGPAPADAETTRRVDDEPWPDDDEWEEEPDCLICGGDGFVFGASFGDPLWYDENKVYACKSCGGSGLRKDMTYW